MEEVDFHDARIAAGNGDLSTVEAWLSQGGDVNHSGSVFGRSTTSLLAAAILGRQTQMCEYLVARGGRCGKSDVYCLLEVFLASPSYLEIARLLIEHGADPAMGGNGASGGWGTPHKLAVLVGRNDSTLERQARSRGALLIRLLVEKGAPVDLWVTSSLLRLGVGTTPLLVAVAQSAPVDYLRELLRLGADLSATNEEGDSAMSLAQSAIYDVDATGSPAAKRAVLTFITDVSRAGTYKRYVNEPRKQLLVLLKLCERGRATAPRRGLLARLFPSPRRRVASGIASDRLPDVLFWKVLSFWRTERDGP